MLELVVLLVLGLAASFGFVLLFGAPYLPTLSSQVASALDLVDLKPGEHLLELGCGDGKVLRAAAERGIQVTGYELNPVLAAIAWLRTRRYRGKVRVICGNFWNASITDANGIFVFLLPKYMAKLDKKIMQESKNNVKLVSFAFAIPGKSVTAEQGGVYLYIYKRLQ